MSDPQPHSDYCPFFVALFLTKLLSGVYFGFITEVKYGFYTIPIAAIMSLTGASIYGDKKCAKG